MWQLIVIISAVLFGFSKLISKFIVSKLKIDTYKYAFYYDLFFSLLYLIFIANFSIPTNVDGWLILLIGGVIWSAIMMLAFLAYKKLDISLAVPLENLVPAIVLFIGVFFLNESASMNKLLGLVLMIIGTLLITFKPSKSYVVNKNGLTIMIIVVLLSSVVTFIDNFGVDYFNIYTYGFGVSILPAIFIAAYMKLKKMNFSVNKKEASIIAIVATIDLIGYLLILYAYTITEVSNIAILRQLSIAIAVIGGFIVHKEKGIVQKSIAAALIIIGAIIISI